MDITLQELRGFVMKMGKHSSEQNVDVQVDTEKEFRCKIYTDNNCYSIVANAKEDGKTYLGCIAKSRKPRAGEDWVRGSDLADGELTAGTFIKILGDIVAYELVKVHKTH